MSPPSEKSYRVGCKCGLSTTGLSSMALEAPGHDQPGVTLRHLRLRATLPPPAPSRCLSERGVTGSSVLSLRVARSRRRCLSSARASAASAPPHQRSEGGAHFEANVEPGYVRVLVSRRCAQGAPLSMGVAAGGCWAVPSPLALASAATGGGTGGSATAATTAWHLATLPRVLQGVGTTFQGVNEWSVCCRWQRRYGVRFVPCRDSKRIWSYPAHESDATPYRVTDSDGRNRTALPCRGTAGLGARPSSHISAVCGASASPRRTQVRAEGVPEPFRRARH